MHHIASVFFVDISVHTVATNQYVDRRKKHNYSVKRVVHKIWFGSLCNFECEIVVGDDKKISDDRTISSGETICLDIDKSGICAFKEQIALM